MFKKWAKKFLIVALELLLISVAFWYLIEKRGLRPPSFNGTSFIQHETDDIENKENSKPFPAETDPVEKKYVWQYKGRKYELNHTLYKSSYDFYVSQPKTFLYTGELPTDWEDQYYGMFLRDVGDKETERLAEEIRNLGIKNRLTEDQIVDLTLSFVQSIAYDDAKAKEILSKAENISVRYPYEVLFDQLGVCSDKSILAAALLRQMGYGTALFIYENDNHMAVAVQCPKDYSTYGSGYCYAETTAVGNKIGIIPNFDQTSNRTVTEFANFDKDGSPQGNTKQLGEVTILQTTQGNLYEGVSATQKVITEITELKKEIEDSFKAIQALKKVVIEEEGELKKMNERLIKYKNEENAEKFNSLVTKYNDLLETYEKNLKKYNSSVAIYNQTIARYNLLIKE